MSVVSRKTYFEPKGMTEITCGYKKGIFSAGVFPVCLLTSPVASVDLRGLSVTSGSPRPSLKGSSGGGGG